MSGIMIEVSNSAPDAVWFQHRVLKWAGVHGRTFPWRQQNDPYAILTAEMMLHRTRAEQVVPIYQRFLKQFPDVRALADADETAVQRVLAPLGLGWRLANFQRLARTLIDVHGGQVPRQRELLLALPGVGPYIADAVRVFAFDEPAALIDTNTVRVAGRYFGFATDAESRRKRHVQKAVAALIDPVHPRQANLAVLDLAAVICRPKDPLCARCPVGDHCIYGKGTGISVDAARS